MKYLKKFESLYIEQDITDICQDLKDDDSVRILFIDTNKNQKCVIIRTTDWESCLEWSYIKDICLRIKDYLDDNYLDFKYLPAFGSICDSYRITTSHRHYESITLDDNTSIDPKILGVAIYYQF
jgi:hypothetical protein